ncbi:MAG: fructose-6-phosphate aldolase [Deltaproteobacteria bacterium]|nr:fructose-6-phosphate aldolase [Deltaproteobacteria bacterium]
MKLFIDTANLSEIEDSLKKGIVSGITTNPSIISKEPKSDFLGHIKKIISLTKKYNDGLPISVEVFATKPSEMISQGLEFYEKLDYKNIAIKVPIGWDELEVISELSKKGIPVNCTCCFSESQMMLAALAGAKYVSLFYNRLLDVSGYPLNVIEKVATFLNQSKLNCEIIVGSIRREEDIVSSWNKGAHIVTAGYKIVSKMCAHPQTTASVNQFISDFQSWLS